MSAQIPRVARFERVSRAQFEADWKDAFPNAIAPCDALKCPRRATAGAAGYDFYAPAAFALDPGATIKIPTGIRAVIDDGWVLMIFPRSGLGFKYRLTLNNTVGVVDADYAGADNEGHIFIKMTNAGDRPLSVAAGEAFAQGVFLPFGVTLDDDPGGHRTGGFGSTDRKTNGG